MSSSQSFHRFRSTIALLGEFQELERQEIYFAPPEQLNDALEGFANTIWKGDKILWRNLLRHYVLVLLQTACLATVAGKEFSSASISNFVNAIDSDLPEAPIREIYDELVTGFLKRKLSREWIDGLSNRKAELSREELSGYLRVIHILALDCVISALGRRQIKVTRMPLKLKPLLKLLPESLAARFAAQDQAVDMRRALLAVTYTMQTQLYLLADVGDKELGVREPWIFLFRDFPDAYTRALEGLLFPDWSAACFVKDPRNAAMWGVYADGHKGVCLQFRTQSDKNQCSTLTLEGPIGFGGSNDETRVLYGEREYRFEPIRYASDYPVTDFFRNLGRLSRYKLSDFWYVGEGGELSDRVSDIMEENEDWRRSYWERHAQAITTKLPQWGHEEEHRLVLSGNLVPRDDIKHRKLKYRLSDLAGVIFGIKTTHADKVAIIRILASKAKTSDCVNISFYQAGYSNHNGQFDILPLSHITASFAKLGDKIS